MPAALVDIRTPLDGQERMIVPSAHVPKKVSPRKKGRTPCRRPSTPPAMRIPPAQCMRSCPTVDSKARVPETLPLPSGQPGGIRPPPMPRPDASSLLPRISLNRPGIAGDSREAGAVHPLARDALFLGQQFQPSRPPEGSHFQAAVPAGHKQTLPQAEGKTTCREARG